MKKFVFLLVLGVTAVVARPSAMIPEQVRIETGLLEGTVGTTQPSVRAFKGIPYAGPTWGANRFMPPVAVRPWKGIRSSMHYGEVSPQPPRAGWI